MRFAHLSDIHFGGENVAALEGARCWLAANRADLTVVSGDLTRAGEATEFTRAADWMASLRPPLLITPGNHDTPFAGIWERLTAPFALYQHHFGDPRSADWQGSGARVRAVNTARGVQIRWNWSKGELAHAQATAVIDRLAGRPSGDLAVLVCHHPLVEMAGGPMTARVRGGEAAARRFCDAGVDLVLTGHIHAPFAMALPYGDGLTYAVGASTLSIRERGAPPGFNVIDIDAETIRVAAHGWSGSHYEPWRSWTLPRRLARAADRPA